MVLKVGYNAIAVSSSLLKDTMQRQLSHHDPDAFIRATQIAKPVHVIQLSYGKVNTRACCKTARIW